MHFHSERIIADEVIEREFILDDIPGILWTPGTASASTPVPLILLGHPGGMKRMYPRLVARALQSAALGVSTATIELPGAGDRPPIDAVGQARSELQRALHHGEPVTADIVNRLVLPLVQRAVPELQTTLDALLAQPMLRGPVGYSGGVIAIGVRLAATDPRIAAAGLFAGSYVPATSFDEARRVTIPIHVLLQWDDHGNDRQAALDLFDALGSAEKTLHANMGGHTGVPSYAAEDAARFFARHLLSPT